MYVEALKTGNLMKTAFLFDNSYVRLPERFFSRCAPSPVRMPSLIKINFALAYELCLEIDYLKSPEGVEVLSGNHLPHGSEPVSMVYAGHQFGSWVQQLGDGRAVLLGEVKSRHSKRYDIQLKGAGRTPYSRMGDGRSGLGPVLREYIVSEAMAALGIPTTRALAAVSSGEYILRERPIPGAILTRVAESHIRVGTFQFFAAHQDIEALTILSEYVIERHFSNLCEVSKPYHRFLEAVIDRQAALIAKWMSVGFIHGVMNTDNVSIAGETIDYGPCAFMDTFHYHAKYSSIDSTGRYSYSKQPVVSQWNMACFAQCLLPLISRNSSQESALVFVQEAIRGYSDIYKMYWLKEMRKKIGLVLELNEDELLINDLLKRMANNRADYTLTFLNLCKLFAASRDNDFIVNELFDDPNSFDGWAFRWRERLALEKYSDTERYHLMRKSNPCLIPRNHQIESVIQSGVLGDYGPFEEIVDALSTPFEQKPNREHFMAPPRPHEIVQSTFCGT
ncbi:MAG: Protein adenylyltransferase SelO [Hyphomicrobiaceae bacterium hypho_1]